MSKRRSFSSGAFPNTPQGARFQSDGGGAPQPNDSARIHGSHAVNVGEAINLNFARDPRQAVLAELEAYRRDMLGQVEAELADVHREAQAKALAIHAEAEAQARQVLVEAEAQKAAIEQAARQTGEEQGYRDGYAAGLADAESETVTALESIQALMTDAYEARRQVLKGFKKQTATLVSTICQKILGHWVTTQPEAFLAVVEQAITSLNLEGQVQVVVSQTAYDAIRTLSRDTEQALANVTRLKWVIDPNLSHQQVYVLSATCNHSLDIEDQVLALVKAMTPLLPVPDFIEPPAVQQKPLDPVDPAIEDEVSAAALALPAPKVPIA